MLARMAGEGDLGTRRRGAVISAIAGLFVSTLGVVLFFLGWTYKEPAERLATRPVGHVAPVGLTIFGGIVVLVGLVVTIRGAISRR